MELFSVLIVNYKGWDSLKDCLNSLKEFNSKRYILEVIIVDNCSNDDEIENFKILFSNYKFIINSGNNGFANGCNLAAKNATSQNYLFLNPDTKVTTKDLEIYFDYFLKDNHAVLSCLQIDENKTFYKQHNLLPKFTTFFGLSRAIYRKTNKTKISNLFNENETYFYPEWVTGAVVLINKNWFEKINGWNEDYWMYMEDVDLCKRIIDKGGKISVLKKATLFHKHGGASRINIVTKALTKTEVIISKHVYIQNTFSFFAAFILHLRLILGVILEKYLLAFLSIPLFFIPKLRVNRNIAINYCTYLFSVLKNKTFISPRAINFKKQK